MIVLIRANKRKLCKGKQNKNSEEIIEANFNVVNFLSFKITKALIYCKNCQVIGACLA